MARVYAIKSGRNTDTYHKFMSLKMAMGKTVAVYDLETTGLNEKEDKILQFAAILFEIHPDGWKKVKEENIFLNPGVDIPEEISKINHITNDMVKDCPYLEDVKDRIKEIMSADYWCGHNLIGFDNKWLRTQVYEGKNLPSGYYASLDTLDGSVDIIPHKACFKYKLTSVSKFFGIEVDEDGTAGAHDALFDIRLCAELAQTLVSVYERAVVPPKTGYENPAIIPKIYSVRPWKAEKSAYTWGNYYFVSTDCGQFAYNRYEQTWRKKDVFRPVSLQVFIKELYKTLGIESDTELNFWDKEHPEGIRF